MYNEEEDAKNFACCASPVYFQDSVMIKFGEEMMDDVKKFITSSPRRHLYTKHEILSDNSKKKRSTINENETRRHELMIQFKGNMKRLCELQWVKMILLARLPFFLNLKVLRDTMHYTCI